MIVVTLANTQTRIGALTGYITLRNRLGNAFAKTINNAYMLTTLHLFHSTCAIVLQEKVEF